MSTALPRPVHAVPVVTRKQPTWLRQIRGYGGALRRIAQPTYAAEYLADAGRRWQSRHLLAHARGGQDTCWLEDPDEPDPLVTIRISTKDRPDLLVERSVAAACRQSYENIEILVVGDGCDGRTEAALRSVNDPRLRYVNLGRTGRYPSDSLQRWLVAGSTAMNAGLLLSSGDWIAPCDDDDEFTDDHVELLLRHAQENRLEFVWSKTAIQNENGIVREIGSESFADVTHGAVLYSMGLSFFQYSATAYRLYLPADQHLWSRMRRAGVKTGFLDRVTYRYYPAGPA